MNYNPGSIPTALAQFGSIPTAIAQSGFLISTLFCALVLLIWWKLFFYIVKKYN